MMGCRVCLRSGAFCVTVEDRQERGEVAPLKTPKPPQRGAAARATDQSLRTVDPVRTLPPNQAVFARFEPQGRFACSPLRNAWVATPQESYVYMETKRSSPGA